MSKKQEEIKRKPIEKKTYGNCHLVIYTFYTG